MRKAVLSVAIACALVRAGAWAASCDRPEHAFAVRTAALQQEMMVAAFMCRDIESYNSFVLSHQAALQESDRVLRDFFLQANAKTWFEDYNFYKTELANTSSLRSVRDPWFCARANANFKAAMGRPLDQAVASMPYPVDTGSLKCQSYAAAVDTAPPPPKKPKRHRGWLGRLVDGIAP